MKSVILLFLLLSPICILAQQQYQVCFTPAERCTQIIVNHIGSAKHSIHVQAYSFTSKPIINALIKAHHKGIEVWIIIDKGQYKEGKRKASNDAVEADIPVWIDWMVSIQHNKVMIIDNQEVITGSFNFSKSADMHNAENLLIIRDSALAAAYQSNFIDRLSKSRRIP